MVMSVRGLRRRQGRAQPADPQHAPPSWPRWCGSTPSASAASPPGRSTSCSPTTPCASSSRRTRRCAAPASPRTSPAPCSTSPRPASSWVTGKVFQVDGGTERPSIDVPAPPLLPASEAARFTPGLTRPDHRRMARPGHSHPRPRESTRGTDLSSRTGTRHGRRTHPQAQHSSRGRGSCRPQVNAVLVAHRDRPPHGHVLLAGQRRSASARRLSAAPGRVAPIDIL